MTFKKGKISAISLYDSMPTELSASGKLIISTPPHLRTPTQPRDPTKE